MTTPMPAESTEDGRAFLQERVGRFDLYASWIGWFFVVFRFSNAVLGDERDTFVDASVVFHVLAALSLLSI